MAFHKLLHRAFQDQRNPLYHKVNDVLSVIILISVGFIIAESVEPFGIKHRDFFHIAEWVVVAIFSAEYLIYIYLAKSKTKYIFSLLGIIDLLAILPTYLGVFLPAFGGVSSLRALRVLRVIRLLRLFRILKLLRYSHDLRGGKKSVLDGVRFANIEIYFFALFSLVVVTGTLMYLAEGRVPGTEFVNIPAGMWWAIVTLTTVGYGDMVPATVLGKIIAGFTMVAGLSMFALLISVMGKVLQNVLFGGSVESSEK